METKDISASRNSVLAQVAPDRRRFLGMLLAGAAAAPLLTSAAFAQDGHDKTTSDPTASKIKTALKPTASKASPSAPTAPKSQPARPLRPCCLSVPNKSASDPTASKTNPSVPSQPAPAAIKIHPLKSTSAPAAQKGSVKQK
jgi:hypothetical protein